MQRRAHLLLAAQKKKRRLSDESDESGKPVVSAESKQSEPKLIVIDDSQKVCDAVRKSVPDATVLKVPKLEKGEKYAEQETKPGLTPSVWESTVSAATSSQYVSLVDCDMTLFPDSVDHTEMLTVEQLKENLKTQQGIMVGGDTWTTMQSYIRRFLEACIEQAPIQVVLWTKNNKYNIIRRLVHVWNIPEIQEHCLGTTQHVPRKPAIC